MCSSYGISTSQAHKQLADYCVTDRIYPGPYFPDTASWMSYAIFLLPGMGCLGEVISITIHPYVVGL